MALSWNIKYIVNGCSLKFSDIFSFQYLGYIGSLENAIQ